MQRRTFSKLAVATALASTPLAAQQAMAYEAGYSGFVIGPASFWTAPATAPAPGLYGNIYGQLSQNKIAGPGAPAIGGIATQLNDAPLVANIVYVPGFNIFGAVYSAGFGQEAILVAGTNPINTSKVSFHNTGLTPISLSWKLGESGFYVRTTATFFPPDGAISGTAGLSEAGVPWYTIFPRLTVAYQSRGWTFNNNLAAEYNTVNPHTGYQTGIILRDEATLTRTFGRLTFGPGIFYLGQVTNDTSSKFYNFAINTERYSTVGVGGLAGYDLGQAALTIHGYQQIIATASGGTPSARVPGDSANTFRGFGIFSTVSFKLPGIGALGQPLDFGALRDPVVPN